MRKYNFDWCKDVWFEERKLIERQNTYDNFFKGLNLEFHPNLQKPFMNNYLVVDTLFKEYWTKMKLDSIHNRKKSLLLLFYATVIGRKNLINITRRNLLREQGRHIDRNLIEKINKIEFSQLKELLENEIVTFLCSREKLSVYEIVNDVKEVISFGYKIQNT